MQVGELVLEDGDTLILDGIVTAEEISGAGKAKATGNVEASNLLIDSGVTLDLTEGTLEVSEIITLDGILDLGADGWDSVTFGTRGNIILAEANANLKINGTTIKWYTLDGAKAKYYKADDKIQLKFIEGSGDHRVIPAKAGAATTEIITRVGEGVTFDANDKKGLKLGSGELILEDGSITITSGDWWTDETTFDVENGAIVTNVGAKVKDENNELWLGGTESEKWKLSGSVQIRFERVDGNGKTTVKSTETLNDAQLEIADWSHFLGHHLVIENNAKVLISRNNFMASDGINGDITVEEEGVLEIGYGVEFKVYKKDQLTVFGGLIVNRHIGIGFDGVGSILMKKGSKLTKLFGDNKAEDHYNENKSINNIIYPLG